MVCVCAWPGFLSVELFGRIDAFLDESLNMVFVNVLETIQISNDGKNPKLPEDQNVLFSTAL